MFGMMVITNAGAALVRQAASGSKKLVFTRAKSGSQWDDSRADLANKPADWYDGIEGTISGVKAGSDGLKVVASFTAADIGDLPVKSVCICAQIKKDGIDPEYDEAEDVIFAATCNDNSCFTIADSFSVSFDLPIPMSAVVDDSGSTSGDYVTLDTDQTITCVKTFKPTDSPSSLYFSDYGLLTLDALSEGGVFLSIDPLNAEVGIKLDAESSQKGFMINTMPLEAAYSTANKTIDLTLGDGTVVRLTCTNVEENPE